MIAMRRHHKFRMRRRVDNLLRWVEEHSTPYRVVRRADNYTCCSCGMCRSSKRSRKRPEWVEEAIG